MTPQSFKKWDDSVPYLGKKVRACLVEMPDVVGDLISIELRMDKEKVTTAYLGISGYRYGKFEYFKCSPEENIISKKKELKHCNNCGYRTVRGFGLESSILHTGM